MKMHVKQEKRDWTLANICASCGWEESEAIEQKIEELYDKAEDMEEMAKMGSQGWERCCMRKYTE